MLGGGGLSEEGKFLFGWEFIWTYDFYVGRDSIAVGGRVSLEGYWGFVFFGIFMCCVVLGELVVCLGFVVLMLRWVGGWVFYGVGLGFRVFDIEFYL